MSKKTRRLRREAARNAWERRYRNRRWAIEIQKTSLDSRELADLMKSIGNRIVDGVVYPAFTSDEIRQLNHPEQVWFKAKEVRELFVEKAKPDPDFTLGSIIDYSTKATQRHGFMEANIELFTVSTFSAELTVSPPEWFSDEQIEHWEAKRSEENYQQRLELSQSRLQAVAKK